MKIWVDKNPPKKNTKNYMHIKNIDELKSFIAVNESYERGISLKIESIDINQGDPGFFDFLRWLHDTRRDDKYKLFHH